MVDLRRIDMGPLRGHTEFVKQLNLRISDELHAQLTGRAETDRRSLNGEIIWLLEKALRDEIVRAAGADAQDVHRIALDKLRDM